jgi:signal transduction histidine kinase
MNTKLLGVSGILLALASWAVLVLLRQWLYSPHFTVLSVVTEFGLVLIGSALFWRWITSMLDRQAVEVREHTRHLEALHSASIALTTEHDLTAVLQKVTDLSRALLNAKYGALGIIGEDGVSIDQMITSGISAAARARLDQFPHTHGLLGAPILERRPVRVDSIAGDARARGFPANHPRMNSFLGVPIVSKGRVFGNLYLADKLPDPSGHNRTRTPAFTEQDQGILEMFANQAAIAIENAQLYRQNEQIAILQERERFGMDLHDGVIQSIYAIGLMLDESRHRLESEPEAARQGLEAAMTGLNQVIADIRNYIHNLRSQQLRGRNLQQGLEELARNLQTYSVLGVKLDVDEAALKHISPKQTADLLQIAREALSNVRKHAHATQVTVRLAALPTGLTFSVEDNGVGFPEGQHNGDGGHGLRNMAERARKLNAVLAVGNTPNGGTRVDLTIPG